MKKKYVYFLAGTFVLSCFIFVYLKNKKNKKPMIKNVDFKMGNDITKIDNLIFSMPVTKFTDYSVIIVFGGINYATPTWMLSQVPKELLSKAIFVFAPYTMSYANVSQKINDFIAKNKLLIKDTSVLGFSAGALNVQKINSKSFKLVGLIDPSTRSEYLNLPFTNNAKIVYNDSNWGSLPQIKSILPKLADTIKSSGGDSEKVSLSHDKIPKYFFSKYKDLIA